MTRRKGGYMVKNARLARVVILFLRFNKQLKIIDRRGGT